MPHLHWRPVCPNGIPFYVPHEPEVLNGGVVSVMLGWSPRLVQRSQPGGPAGEGYGRPSPLGYLSRGSGDVVAPDHAGRVQERQAEPGHGANPSAVLLHSREPLDSGALASHELQPSRLDSLPVSLPRSRHGPLLAKRRKGTRECTDLPPCCNGFRWARPIRAGGRRPEVALAPSGNSPCLGPGREDERCTASI